METTTTMTEKQAARAIAKLCARTTTVQAPPLSDDAAAKMIAKLTAKLSRLGRQDLADAIIGAVQPSLCK